jgi:Ni/Fe-hydrogenase subunit HybB-like protein
MVIFESTISSKVFKRGLEVELLGKLALAIPVALGAYLVLKIADLAYAGELDLLFKGNMNTALFWVELGGGVILPTILFLLPAIRRSATGLFWGALLVIAGVVLNRFDTSLIGVARPEGASYVPHIMEFIVTISVIAAGVFAYSMVARFLPLFTEQVTDMAMHRKEAPVVSAGS